MNFEEKALIELLKIIKRRSTYDARHHKPFNIFAARNEIEIIRTAIPHLIHLESPVTVDEETYNGVICHHTKIPTNPHRVIFYLHGGGYIFERTSQTREAAIALACNANIILPQYRLAPESPHPSAITDAYNAYLGVIESGIDPHNIFIGGDSAGGGLALALLLKLRDERKPLPKACFVLSPWTDMTLSSESMITKAKADPLLDAIVLRDVAGLILQGHAPTDPYISPIFGNFNGLPPIGFFVGGREILLNDSTRTAEVARSHGVDVTIDIDENMFHTYPLYDSIFDESKDAIKRIEHFIHKHHR